MSLLDHAEGEALARALSDLDPAAARPVARLLRTVAAELTRRANDHDERTRMRRDNEKKIEHLKELAGTYVDDGHSPERAIEMMRQAHGVPRETAQAWVTRYVKRVRPFQREREIMRLARQGHSDRYIAARLGISPTTVSRTVRRVLRQSKPLP